MKYVRPQYPTWARRRNIQGTVEFTATIAKDGSLRDLKFIKGPMELVPFAEKALSNWRYDAPKFNGTPVEVKTDILIPFTLNQ